MSTGSGAGPSNTCELHRRQEAGFCSLLRSPVWRACPLHRSPSPNQNSDARINLCDLKTALYLFDPSFRSTINSTGNLACSQYRLCQDILLNSSQILQAALAVLRGIELCLKSSGPPVNACWTCMSAMGNTSSDVFNSSKTSTDHRMLGVVNVRNLKSSTTSQITLPTSGLFPQGNVSESMCLKKAEQLVFHLVEASSTSPTPCDTPADADFLKYFESLLLIPRQRLKRLKTKNKEARENCLGSLRFKACCQPDLLTTTLDDVIAMQQATDAITSSVFAAKMLGVLGKLIDKTSSYKLGSETLAKQSMKVSLVNEVSKNAKTEGSTKELFEAVCYTLYDCLDHQRRCSANALCEHSQRVVLEAERFATRKTRTIMRSMVTMICQTPNLSREVFGGRRRRVQLDKNEGVVSTNSCRSYCSPVQPCFSPMYVLSFKEDLLNTSYTPEAAFANFTMFWLNQSGFGANLHYVSPRCSLSGHPATIGASNFLFLVLRGISSTVSTVLMVLSFFGMFLAYCNRHKMLENPRRSFLYLSFAFFYAQLQMIGFILPKRFVWCNSDGSLVVSRGRNAHPLCVASALFRSANLIAVPLSIVWICFVWSKLIKKLTDVRRATPLNTMHECVFAIVYVLAPWISAMAQFAAMDHPYEGQPLLSVCTLLRSQPQTDPTVGISTGLFVLCGAVCSVLFFRTGRLLQKLEK